MADQDDDHMNSIEATDPNSEGTNQEFENVLMAKHPNVNKDIFIAILNQVNSTFGQLTHLQQIEMYGEICELFAMKKLQG
ncbi:hypothetical protein DMENIID0001_167200 [Sergentomyia squamirostris]